MSARLIWWIDLVGSIALPSLVVYIIYLATMDERVVALMHSILFNLGLYHPLPSEYLIERIAI
jgi:hypothetical protein